MKYFATPIVLTLFLSACGGGSDSEPTNTNTTTPDQNVITRTITTNGGNITVSETQDIELTITGNDNTITIESPLSELMLTGNRNLLIFVTEPTVADCLINGISNTAETSTGTRANLNCSVIGNDNEGF